MATTESQRLNARHAKRRQLRAQRMASARDARQAALAAQMQGMDAITLYRAEKAKREAKNAAELTAAIASAKALLERAA